MLLVGLDHKNYKENLEEATKINNLLNKMYPGISRGIYKKYVSNFNQDLANNIILIELGGMENNLEEVMNTSIVLSEVIKEYLEEKYE